MEQGLHAVQVLGWLIGVSSIFHFDAPLTAPLSINLHPKFDVHTLDRFLVHRHLHQDEHVWNQHTRRALVQLRILLTQPPLHIPCVYTIVHDMESWVEER